MEHIALEKGVLTVLANLDDSIAWCFFSGQNHGNQAVRNEPVVSNT